MSFRDYVSAKAVPLCMGGIGGLYGILAARLCGVPLSLGLMLVLSCVPVVLFALLTGWRRRSTQLKALRGRLDTLPEKYLIGETLERPKDPVELEYYLLMKEISRSAIGAVEQAKREKQDYCDYVESWVHEIKTPLTACSLILANGGDSAKLRRELRRTDNLTETILTYAKLRTAEKDTQISPTALRSICHQAIREEMELLISAGISVNVEGDCTVYTDPKLMAFILKQLLINCAKYCPDCQILMEMNEGVLTVQDNGPGIPAHELSRVTERGFTGAAGRNHGGSTGMGLYIVSELCKTLNIQMEITSKVDAFARFLFRFPSHLTKL